MHMFLIYMMNMMNVPFNNTNINNSSLSNETITPRSLISDGNITTAASSTDTLLFTSKDLTTTVVTSLMKRTLIVHTELNTTTAVATTEGVEDQTVYGATLLVINFLIIVLNVLTILVITRFRTKNTIDLLVLALATTDLVKGLIPVPITIYVYLTKWRLVEDTHACNFYGWIAFATNSGSMLILMFMSIERYLAIVKPLHYRTWVRPKKVLGLLILSLFFTAFHSSLPLMGVGRIKSYNNGAYSHFDYSRENRGTIAYSTFILCYGLGMIIVVTIAYSFVFYKIRDLIKRHQKMSHARRGTGMIYDKANSRRLKLKTETMFSYLTVALMTLFSFSWLPFLMVVIASQIGAKPPHEKLDLFAMRIVVVNSMLNPIACAALCKPYRRGILYYFKMCFSLFGFKKPQSDIWDPWTRESRRIRNTRRHAPSVTNRTGSDLYPASFDLESNIERKSDFYCSSVSEASASSSSSPSSSTTATNERQKKSNSRKESRQKQSNENNDDINDSKDYNKNIVGGASTGNALTPLQHRRIIFMDKVQKYLGQKRKKANSRGDIYRRTNSADDILSVELLSKENKANNGHQRKMKSFNLKTMRSVRKNSTSDTEEDESDQLLVPRRDRARTFNIMEEIVDTVDNDGDVNDRSSTTSFERVPHDTTIRNEIVSPLSLKIREKDTDCDEITPTNVNNLTNGGVHLTKSCSQDIEIPTKETDRRCISEAYPENMTILGGKMAMKHDDPVMPASEQSLVMIDKLTKDLVKFSQTSLNKNGMENGKLSFMPV